MPCTNFVTASAATRRRTDRDRRLLVDRERWRRFVGLDHRTGSVAALGLWAGTGLREGRRDKGGRSGASMSAVRAGRKISIPLSFPSLIKQQSVRGGAAGSSQQTIEVTLITPSLFLAIFWAALSASLSSRLRFARETTMRRLERSETARGLPVFCDDNMARPKRRGCLPPVSFRRSRPRRYRAKDRRRPRSPRKGARGRAGRASQGPRSRRDVQSATRRRRARSRASISLSAPRSRSPPPRRRARGSTACRQSRRASGARAVSWPG